MDSCSCSTFLKGLQSQKKHHPRSYQCDQQQRSPQKRLPEAFSLQFSSSRYRRLTPANLLALHHKSRVCHSNMIYQETGPKAGCKIYLGKMTNFWTELLSLPVPWHTGYICNASPTNERVSVSDTTPSLPTT